MTWLKAPQLLARFVISGRRNRNGPRYDPDQTSDKRHGYGNLILLCANHHKIIDDDQEAYTINRLLKLKDEHASRFISLSDAEAEMGARALIDHSVASNGQSGGITAHTVNQVFNVHPPLAGIADSVRRQSEARKFLAPELQRTIERVLYIHGRSTANFICHSAENGIMPNDKKTTSFPTGQAYIPMHRRFASLGRTRPRL